MTEPVSTQQALVAIDAAAREWDDLVATVGPDRHEEMGPDGRWTFKDFAGHLSDWENRTIDLLEDPTAAPPWGEDLDTDAVNEFIHRHNAARPAEDILRDAAAVYLRLRGFVSELSDAELNDPAHFPALNGDALGPQLVGEPYFDHIRGEHAEDIAYWRSSAPTY